MTARAAPTAEVNIHLRARRQDKDIIDQAAGLVGANRSQFMLSSAIKEAKNTSKPITLLVVVDDYFQTSTINYHGGERYPHLVKEDGKPDYLDEIIKARATAQ